MLTVAARILAALAIGLSGAWLFGALWYQGPGPDAVRLGLASLAALWAVWVLGTILIRGRIGIAGGAYLAAFVGALIWWATLEPRTDRVWAPEMAQGLSYTQVSGTDAIVVQNVRNFDWTSISTAHQHWEDRRYDLSQITGIDVFMLYWMGEAIAHSYFSFTFADGQALSISAEIRKEKDEPYSSIAGFFKRYELAIIAGDERDFLGWRIHAPHETVQLFRTNATPAEARALLLALLDDANTLTIAPRFYNTLTANCTTAVWTLTRSLGDALPLDTRVLLSGYLPDYLYDLGRLDKALPLDELRKRGDTMPRVKAALAAGLIGADFSRALREGVPTP